MRLQLLAQRGIFSVQPAGFMNSGGIITLLALFLQSSTPENAAPSRIVSGGISIPQSASQSSSRSQIIVGGNSGGTAAAGGSAGVSTFGGPGVYTYVVPKGSLMPRSQARAYPGFPGQVGSGGQAGGGNSSADGSIPNNPFPSSSPNIAGPSAPLYFPPVQQRYLIRPQPRVPSSTAPPVQKELGPRQPSVYEYSGPLYGEVDPDVEYVRAQAARGNPQSQFALGMRYLTGNGVIQNEQIALEWLRSASANGELRAREKLRELRRRSPKLD